MQLKSESYSKEAVGTNLLFLSQWLDQFHPSFCSLDGMINQLLIYHSCLKLKGRSSKDKEMDQS